MPAAVEPTVAFVSYRAAKCDGDGGNHRTYQILCDLQAEFGEQRVWCLALEDWVANSSRRPVRPHRAGWLTRAGRRATRMVENPYKLLTREAWSQQMRFGTRGVLALEFVDDYRAQVNVKGHPDICVVDHPIFDQIRLLNDQSGIPTVVASHNIESLDVSRVQLRHLLNAHSAGIDLANELRALSRYHERFAISKVECSLLTGIGLSCRFYPYVPAGEVRDKLIQIAANRLTQPVQSDLFLLMGTAFHAPTRRSLEWFIHHAAEYGLPDGARVVVVGDSVMELAASARGARNIELRGRISESDLDRLLSTVGTALVPQRMGFGALTRIAELACAGVPVLTFPHASFAIDPSPGVRVLDDDTWPTLVDAMAGSMQTPRSVEPAAYAEWEAQSARPLGPALRQLMMSQHSAVACLPVN